MIEMLVILFHTPPPVP